MFVSSKVRAKITDADPVFKTRYLGNAEVFVPNGTGCTNAPVQKLWDNSGDEKGMKRVATIINVHGIFMKDSENKKDEGKLFPIENISFCNAESIANGKIFSWISKEEIGHKLICHAVLCSTPEKAKSMALVMSRAFQIAYKEWKMEQNSTERNGRKDGIKTSDLKLKPKYQIPKSESPSVQDGDVLKSQNTANITNGLKSRSVVSSRSSDHVKETSAHDEDSKSSHSSTSSGRESTGSKFKDSECQTSDTNHVDREQNDATCNISKSQESVQVSIYSDSTLQIDASISAETKIITEQTQAISEEIRNNNEENVNQETISLKL